MLDRDDQILAALPRLPAGATFEQRDSLIADVWAGKHYFRGYRRRHFAITSVHTRVITQRLLICAYLCLALSRFATVRVENHRLVVSQDHLRAGLEA